MNSETTVRLRIHGRVQGVNFRYTMAKRARALNLDGWVRNLNDGTVEAMATGPPEAVEALIVWAHTGPPAASVQKVDVQREPGTAVDAGFRIR